ncbi:MAG: hypothetical protein JW809_12430 [Pirellulales bacterium]|nr:hypothetical protein [Pirellulales bacterium]
MRNYWMAFAVALCLATPAAAQQRPSTTPVTEPEVSVSSSQVPATPEMWFYQQELRQSLDPQMVVRRNAEQRAHERHQRIAARKWFGYSNLRPTASPDPFNGEYSPYWAGNNNLYPSRWSGYGHPWIVLRPGSHPY